MTCPSHPAGASQGPQSLPPQQGLRRAVAALNTTCTLCMLVYKSIFFFLLLTDCLLHQKFSSHLATVPQMPWVAVGEPGQDSGSTLTAKPGSCRKNQVHWASSFCKLNHLWTCCLCSCGVFLCVPVYFNLLVGFFQINFESNSNQITC